MTKEINIFAFDIETGTNKDAELFMPDFKEPRTTLKGEADKRDKSIEQQRAEWLEKTPLNALTGEILCIGVHNGGGVGVLVGDEYKLLRDFWEVWEWAEHGNTTHFVGHNCYSFDLPYLIRRSYINGIKPPQLFTKKYWASNIFDTMDIWNANQYPKEYISLKNLAKALGVGDKDAETSKHFQELWATDRDKAIEHVLNDVNLTKQIYERLK